MNVDLRILRYDPEHDPAPHWETYQVNVDPMDRVLDLLIKVKADQDGSLSFRRSPLSSGSSKSLTTSPLFTARTCVQRSPTER